MEILMVILILLVLSVALAVVASIIAIVIMAIMKKGLKIPLIALGASVVTFFLLLFTVYGLDDYLSNTSEPVVDITPTESTEIEEPAEEVAEDELETDLATEEIDEENEDSHLTKDGRDPTDFSEYRSDIDVRDIERNPEEYENEWVTFEGKIIQVMEDDVTTGYRIAVNDDYDRVVYLETLTISLDSRFLEDDYVEVYGSFYDLVTYETVVGGSRTIPAFNAYGERITLQEEASE